MTSSPKLLPLTSPSHYSNRAREKRCTRAKEILVDLIKSQTTHDVDPKDVKTTKPSSGVSWRFVVDSGTEFPYVQLSSISRPNLDLLEKAVEGGGVRVQWLNESEIERNAAEDDGSFSESKRPRKRVCIETPRIYRPHAEQLHVTEHFPMQTKHSSDSSHESTNEPSTPTQQSHVHTPRPNHPPPMPTFTTVNEPSRSIVYSRPVPVPAPSPPASSFTEDESRSATISVDIPVSVISNFLAAERNTAMDQLKQENGKLKEDNRRLNTEVAVMQAKYEELQDQLNRKMLQVQEIFRGPSITKDA
ncbi:hypothetical protein DFH27DRAFT_556747 [Peziza echinospora]|nr:hypothetical protein DFH27DRAFT_556747 [Peziza echinospora]